MDNSQENFSKSPLVIASRKAKWIYEGFAEQDPSTTVLLAQTLSSIVHGYQSSNALPNSTQLSYSSINPARNKLSIFEIKKKLFSIKSLLATGNNCSIDDVFNGHAGQLSVICGEDVNLKNVSFKGKGNRNLVVICNGASLENVEISLEGLGLVIIGADSTLFNCKVDTSANSGNDCTLFKTIITFPGEYLSNVNLNSILKRKRLPVNFTKTSNSNVNMYGKEDKLDTSDLFSIALSGKYCKDLRTAEDTKDFRQKLMAKDELIHSFRSIHNTFFSTPKQCSSERKVHVACLMMQRNESSLLKPWIKYYKELFGSENLFIFDNGSDDEEVIEYLSSLGEKENIHVDFSHQSSADFKRKGIIFRKLIEELQHLNHYDIFIPIDCDEFLGIKKGEYDFSVDHEEILATLNNYKFEKNALKIDRFFNNFPSSSSSFYIQNGEKTLFTADTIYKLDRGYHKGESLNGKETKTPLTYLHFHNKPLEELKKHSYNKLVPFFDVDDEQVLLELIKNNNRLAKNLKETHDGYAKRFVDKKKICSNELEKCLEKHGTSIKV